MVVTNCCLADGICPYRHVDCERVQECIIKDLIKLIDKNDLPEYITIKEA